MQQIEILRDEHMYAGIAIGDDATGTVCREKEASAHIYPTQSAKIPGAEDATRSAASLDGG